MKISSLLKPMSIVFLGAFLMACGGEQNNPPKKAEDASVDMQKKMDSASQAVDNNMDAAKQKASDMANDAKPKPNE